MARIRTIKPEIAADVKLASVSRDARYTFILLITQADDEGLIAAGHRQLLGSLYPHDEGVSTADLLTWIEELVGIGVLTWRATVDGAPILEIANWAKHQRVDNKGRSQLAGLLEPSSATRGELRRVAESSGLEVGGRTREVGPRTEDRRPAPAVVVTGVDAFLAEVDFGAFAAPVAALCRSSRNPDAAVAELRLHLQGEMGHELGTPAQVGSACQQFRANGAVFNAALFAGYLRRSKKGAERTRNRQRDVAEDRYIADEGAAKAKADTEAAEASKLLEQFKAAHPDRYAELETVADRQVPTKLTFGRDLIIRGHLLRLIRDEAA